MDQTVRQISAEDINPRHNWGRALPSLGTNGVDFEERVNYQRLHRYRLGRAKKALDNSELGALLVFDVNNIRYLTSTKIGEWERDKLCRWALLTRTGEPILWDFGSAAVHHKLYTPWLAPENCKAGLIGMRDMVDPKFGLMKKHAGEIASLLKEAGVGSGIFYPTALHRHPAFAQWHAAELSLPASERLAEEVISLPLHSDLADDEVGRIIDAVRHCLAGEAQTSRTIAPKIPEPASQSSRSVSR